MVGEASPMYLFLPYVPERLHRHYPHARLIALLRHPLRRAHSNWWMHYTAKREDADFGRRCVTTSARIESGVDFEGAAGEDLWRRNVEAIEDRGFMLFRTYLDEGFYGTLLTRYLERFERDQVLVLDFDELGAGGQEALARVFRFLGVDRLPDARVPHANSAMRDPLAPLVRLAAPLARRELLPRPLIDLGKKLASGRKPPIPVLPEDLRAALAAQYARQYTVLQGVFPDFEVPESWYDFFPGRTG